MKVFSLGIVLGIFALNLLGQTGSTSLITDSGAAPLGSGTPGLAGRVADAFAPDTPFEFPDSPGSSLTQLAWSAGRPDTSGLAIGSTLNLHTVLFVYDDNAHPAYDGPPAEDSRSGSDLAVQPKEPRRDNTRIHWKAANGEALLATGIDHVFNLWTEAGTRDALYGPWAQNWLHSVSELRGWSDSDRFMAPYVGHTIQGSIYGFILRQNDPKYKDVQWGDGREYFMSLLRSMGFSAVWHTQWKIGPISEDSIGNVMLHASPGFITLVDTPTLGIVDMLGEDALDRYLLIGLENRTANGPLIVFARSFLNPGRSFANVMAFKLPWYRATRIGLFGENHAIRQQMVYDFKHNGGPKPFEFVKRQPVTSDSQEGHVFPKVAAIELSAYPNYERFAGRNRIGGGGSGAARLNPSWQIISEINGCLIMGFSKYTQSGDSLFYGAGPRWTPLATHKWSPYAEFLFGGRKVTYEVDNPALENSLLNAWNDGSGTLPHYPKRSDWSSEVASNGPSLAVGGGVDWVVVRPFTWRLFNVQYTHSWMGGVDNIHPQNGIRFTTEAVLRIGTW
ncbi:MAG TPA: hypothetical protein VE779_12580 [Candidatus Angelobacter sp.]|nr:hypothetical protein [Candidatus Angelobacter sp.]